MKFIRVWFQNRDDSMLVTPAQYAAVTTRDQLEASRLGISFDDYMSLIDPNYPVG